MFACHSTDGSRGWGQPLRVFSERTERGVNGGKGESVLVDEAYIRKYISEPNVGDIEGYPPIMPKVSLTEEELNALVELYKEFEGGECEDNS